MTVSLVQRRAVIGIFNCCSSVMPKSCWCNLTSNFISENLLLFYHYQESVYINLVMLLHILVILQCHGDIQLKLDPKKKLKENSLSVCHWNLNSLPAHNFSKLTLLKA